MTNDHHPLHSAKAMDIQVRMCPGGHVYLYVGHTCLFLRQEEFLDVAQIVHAVENHLLEESDAIVLESSQ